MSRRYYWLVLYFALVALVTAWFLLTGSWGALGLLGRAGAILALILLLLAPEWPGVREHTPAAIAASLVSEQQRILKQVGVLKTENSELSRDLESKKAELKLVNQRFQKLDKAKFEFVSVTTHQLRTPLAAMRWTFHMLLTGALGEVSAEQKEFLQKGYESAERAINIINELLNIDYVEAHKTDYQFSPVDLSELAETVSLGFKNQARENQIQLAVLKPSANPPAVEADPRKLTIVLENLVDNALKYTPKGGQVTITLDDSKLNSARSALTISVADTGIGIPSSEQERIFERFFRSTNAVKKVTDGNGLGLAIAKEIVNRHQGEIWFESKEGGGTTFYFTIPLRRQEV
jgi:signal transduction histidine kinase